MLVKGLGNLDALQVRCARLVKENAGLGCKRAPCPGRARGLLVDTGEGGAVIGFSRMQS
jgi:hypothetical protein